MTHLRAECEAAVAEFRIDNPMTDAQAEHMVEQIMLHVRKQEQKLAGIRVMAESMVRKRRETEEMSDQDAFVLVQQIIAFLSRDKPK